MNSTRINWRRWSQKPHSRCVYAWPHVPTYMSSGWLSHSFTIDMARLSRHNHRVPIRGEVVDGVNSWCYSPGKRAFSNSLFRSVPFRRHAWALDGAVESSTIFHGICSTETLPSELHSFLFFPSVTDILGSVLLWRDRAIAPRFCKLCRTSAGSELSSRRKDLRGFFTTPRIGEM